MTSLSVAIDDITVSAVVSEPADGPLGAMVETDIPADQPEGSALFSFVAMTDQGSAVAECTIDVYCTCATDNHCDDGLFCNGLETCNDGCVCIAGNAPCTSDQTCTEGVVSANCSD